MVEPASALGQLGMFVLTVLLGKQQKYHYRIIIGELTLLLVLPVALFLMTRRNPLKFYANMIEAVLVNFGIASSIACLPVTLKCLTEKNGTHHKVSL